MTAELQKRLLELRGRFIKRAMAERARLTEACDLDDRAALQKLAHGLAGNGGMFGFNAISVAASALEQAVDDDVPAGDLRRLSRQLDAEIAALDEALGGKAQASKA